MAFKRKGAARPTVAIQLPKERYGGRVIEVPANFPGTTPVEQIFGPPAPVQLSLVGGEPVVESAHLVSADETTLARAARHAHRRLLDNL